MGVSWAGFNKWACHEIEDTLDIDNRNSFTIMTNKIQKMRLYFVTVYEQQHSYTVCIYMVHITTKQDELAGG